MDEQFSAPNAILGKPDDVRQQRHIQHRLAVEPHHAVKPQRNAQYDARKRLPLVCAAKSTSIINNASRLTARHGISVVIRAESFTTSPPQQSRPVSNAETTLEKRRLYSR